MTHLAKRFGLSDQGLAKICKRFDIPRPKQGHWNKLAAGKRVETIPLSAASAGIGDAITISAQLQGDPIKPEVREHLEAARDRIKIVRIAQRLSRPHPIIAGWIDRREREIKGREKVYDFRLKRVAAPSPFSAQERRRHRVLDALFKALEANQVKVTQNDQRVLHASVGDEKIEFQLRVMLRQVKRPLTADVQRWFRPGDKEYRLELEETNALIFEIKNWLPGGLQRNWRDGRKGGVEDAVTDILATLLAAFPLMAAQRERRAEKERLWQAENQRIQELRRQRKLEQNRFRHLLEHAGRWRDAVLAKGFVAELRAAIPDQSAVIDGKSASEWLEWAETHASRHDPLANPLGVFESIAEVNDWTYRET